MAKSSNRTRPLDRDGDGQDGGSLPGNKTAPMASEAQDASTAEPVDDLADARTTPGDSQEKLDAIECETDEANAAAAAAAAAADGAGDGDDDDDDDDDPHAACGRCAEEHPEGMLQEGLCPSCVDDEEDEAGTASDNAATEAYTFDAEQVEAAHSEPMNLSLDQVKAALGDGAHTPAAFRAEDLRTLANSRFLYKSADGYSPTYAAPFITEEVGQLMIDAGLATFDEQAGNAGALRATGDVRKALSGAVMRDYLQGQQVAKHPAVASFVKKPVQIQALQWTGDNLADVLAFTGKHPKWDEYFTSFEDFQQHVERDGNIFKIYTLEGTMSAQPGDWIIRGVRGEHYPCKPDIFEATYDGAAT